MSDWTLADLERYADGALDPDTPEHAALSEDLRRDPGLRARLARVGEIDALVAEALVAPATPARRVGARRVAAAAAVLLVAVGVVAFALLPRQAPTPQIVHEAPPATPAPASGRPAAIDFKNRYSVIGVPQGGA